MQSGSLEVSGLNLPGGQRELPITKTQRHNQFGVEDSEPTVYSDDSSSNPAKVCRKMSLAWNENKQKRPGSAHF